MVETPELHTTIVKMQRDIEDLKDFQNDSFHLNKKAYEDRVKNCLKNNQNLITLYLSIDGIRSINEIKSDLENSGKIIPTTTLYRSLKTLHNCGLITKIGFKNRNPIFTKKVWAEILRIDDFIRKELSST